MTLALKSFGGQGIVSGFRDAVALSWRLAILCRTPSLNPEQILAGWYRERKQQLEASLASTVKNGSMVNTKNPITILISDWSLWFLQMIPPVRRWIESGPRANGRTRYTYPAGLPFLPERGGGVLFSQTFCLPLVTDDSNCMAFTDDVIFTGKKQRLFQLVVLTSGDLNELRRLKAELGSLRTVCARLDTDEATFFIQRRFVPAHRTADDARISNTYRTATADEFERSPLCIGRPKVRDYKENDMWEGVKHKAVVILRPDRFVFAAVDTSEELEAALAFLSWKN
ncbi:hypothetical protein LTR29_016940 [Friedmanniomyces endolithicus]|uniref:Uncharacterized protein n=1 Tax=Rachicladosporium monterosium TaxID=1507873 RepID=A0ABR0LF02_9PEZI|nr:hypothetical protein LTR29_016940 [Friedmanniomyces endolithicus]KAK5147771.1 hypothetical protein LTR32_000830 [Rachicladosporium monterosium]